MHPCICYTFFVSINLFAWLLFTFRRPYTIAHKHSIHTHTLKMRCTNLFRNDICEMGEQLSARAHRCCIASSGIVYSYGCQKHHFCRRLCRKFFTRSLHSATENILTQWTSFSFDSLLSRRAINLFIFLRFWLQAKLSERTTRTYFCCYFSFAVAYYFVFIANVFILLPILAIRSVVDLFYSSFSFRFFHFFFSFYVYMNGFMHANVRNPARINCFVFCWLRWRQQRWRKWRQNRQTIYSMAFKSVCAGFCIWSASVRHRWSSSMRESNAPCCNVIAWTAIACTMEWNVQNKKRDCQKK